MQFKSISANNIIWICWACFASLLLLFVSLGMTRFIVFMLFIRLVCDLLMQAMTNIFPKIPKKPRMYLVCIIIASIGLLLFAYVLPVFLQGLPEYVDKFQITFNQQINLLVSNFNLSYELVDLKTKILAWLKGNLIETFNFLQKIGKNLFLFTIALIINFAILFKGHSRQGAKEQKHDNMLAYVQTFITSKIMVFYEHFKTVMSAQLIISLINTCLTLLILLLLQIPHKITLLVLVFIFGLLPVVGNIISNTIICSAAFIWSGVWQVVAALVFLVSIHKLEYFLNSKIIGHFTALPMYVTLMALLVGEMLFHISGMIIAVPMVIFIQQELANIKVRHAD